jgi:hypothetical protein
MAQGNKTSRVVAWTFLSPEKQQKLGKEALCLIVIFQVVNSQYLNLIFEL